MNPEFKAIFARLRGILQKQAERRLAHLPRQRMLAPFMLALLTAFLPGCKSAGLGPDQREMWDKMNPTWKSPMPARDGRERL